MASNGSNGSTSAAGGSTLRAGAGGGRVLLACDNCRQRKSRCDGLRPRCSHCVQSGRTCLYRSTPATNLESDATVLARLADTEARLQVLEEKNRMLMATLPLAAATGGSSVAAVLGGSPQSMELFHHQQQQHRLQSQHLQYQQQQQQLQQLQQPQIQQAHPPPQQSLPLPTQNQPQHQQIDSSETIRTPPDLHTAAAFKLLTCWPRLTINMTIPQLDTQTYLTRCDQADPLLRDPAVGNAAGDAIALWQVRLTLEQLYSPVVLTQLPVAIVALLEMYSPFHRDRMLASVADAFQEDRVPAGGMQGSGDSMDADGDHSMDGAADDMNSMNGMNELDEMTVAAATQLQRFHGGSSRNAHGDNLYDQQQQQRLYQQNHQHRQNQQNQQNQQQRQRAHQQAVDYDRLSFGQLLVLSLGFRADVDNARHDPIRTPFDPPPTSLLMAAAARTCSLALQKLWMLQAGPVDDLVPQVLLMAYYLADFWVRPFHARGLLQSVDQAIKHMAMLQADDPRATLYARLHFILESDIITELNGFSTLSSAALLALPPLEMASNGSGPGSGVPVSSLLHAASPPTPSSSVSSAVDSHQSHSHLQQQPQRQPQRLPKFYIENHVRLRILLNRILHLLYAPTKAYAQPHELADIVYSLTAGLREWYQAQPPDQQFVRDATVYNINQPGSTPSTNTSGSATMPLRLRETALRYFGCVFLLHRPVLYFFLHKDLEYTVRPPDNVRTLHVDREPWVLESCRDCIESAALLIHLWCTPSFERTAEKWKPVEDTYGAWCGLQMLFAAYLILLQVRSVPSLQPVFRNIGDMDTLLDKVERVFASHPVRSSMALDKSLAILQDERRNFETSSPLTHMT
ncbi:hypothetical protein SBRCBS47491_007049 [Sporothrix bragantina]|uniref:Zn(2)-C6 fungal-type domain-containing protein n=1 Tax=Sporothrix bragantina TaxID=671064 RepID=A0ABP0C9Y9_9PEZI